MVQHLNEYLFRRKLQAASFLWRKDEDLNPFSDEDELTSSEEVVSKPFNKKEFLLGFQQNMTEVISKLLEKPMKFCGNKQHRKLLHEEKAVPPQKLHVKLHAKQCVNALQLILCGQPIECIPTGTVMHQNVPSTHWGQSRPSKTTSVTHSVMPLITMPSPLGHCTWAQDQTAMSAHPFKGVHPPLGTIRDHRCILDHVEAMRAMQPQRSCTAHDDAICTPWDPPYVQTKTTWPMHSKVIPYVHHVTTPYTCTVTMLPMHLATTQLYGYKATAPPLHTKVTYTPTTTVTPAHSHVNPVMCITCTVLLGHLMTMIANACMATALPSHTCVPHWPWTLWLWHPMMTKLLSHAHACTVPPTHSATHALLTALPVYVASLPPGPLLVGALPMHTAAAPLDLTAGSRMLHTLVLFNIGGGLSCDPFGSLSCFLWCTHSTMASTGATPSVTQPV